MFKLLPLSGTSIQTIYAVFNEKPVSRYFCSLWWTPLLRKE
ncbi:hypothetical protein SAMN04487820_104358 [Actinopolyspora mzabensis]|uniref:Uncharacterized protein n=1 Tax=Actinopolyspora mzabensis TaxID=995066 RepID=A0A1G8ZEA5_ACTMZ|nr:hypothetical protein SAMN04487820_104358 [Actinopolyspora mzabensis]